MLISCFHSNTEAYSAVLLSSAPLQLISALFVALPMYAAWQALISRKEVPLFSRPLRYVSTYVIVQTTDILKVQRALTLWATGAVTMEMVLDAKTNKNKALSLPKVMTLDDGTEMSTSFNDATWGDVTRTRMAFVNNNLRLSSLEKVIQKAKAFVVTTSGGHSKASSSGLTDADKQCAQMVDLSDPENECEWDVHSVFCNIKPSSPIATESQQTQQPIIHLSVLQCCLPCRFFYRCQLLRSLLMPVCWKAGLRPFSLHPHCRLPLPPNSTSANAICKVSRTGFNICDLCRLPFVMLVLI